MVRGVENEFESSTCTWYVVAFVTSLQSSVTGSLTRAPLTGASSDGAAGVPLDPPGCTVSTAPHVVFSRAHTFACVVADTAVVDTVNVVVVAPAATLTLAGTVAGAMAESCTVAPPPGAGAFNVIVAMDVPPPVTVDGLRASPVTQTFDVCAGLIVTLALALDAP